MLFRVGLHDLFILCVFGAIWGGIWASFLCCMAWRLPRGIPLSKYSYCPSCGHRLSPLDLIPVFSWLLLGGKCRYCGDKIPVNHVIAEIAFVIASVLCLLQYGITVIMVRNWLFLCCLLCVALADWDSGTMPPAFCVTGTIVWAGTLPYIGISVQEATVLLLQCALIFVIGNIFFRLLAGLLNFGQYSGVGYHTRCAGLLCLIALYLRLLPTLLSLGLACLLILLFHTRAKSGAKTPSDLIAAMLSVSSAVILLLRI